MVLVHDDWNLRIEFRGREHQGGVTRHLLWGALRPEIAQRVDPHHRKPPLDEQGTDALVDVTPTPVPGPDQGHRPRVALSDLPAPDLFIRTGGELRVSNFLLWQLAYTELWFTDTLWPDVDAATLQRALDDYAGRERRFGLTGAQVAGHATGGTT